MPHHIPASINAVWELSVTLALEPPQLKVAIVASERSDNHVPASLLGAMRERSDRALALLLLAHFPVVLALAPLRKTWLAALLVGGFASGAPMLAARLWPGASGTRIVVSIAFMLYSMLMIAQ